MVDITPTKDRIKYFIPMDDLSHLLCGGDTESVYHISFITQLMSFVG